MIRVVLPVHLRRLAQVEGEVLLEVHAPATWCGVVEALEFRHPVLRGTIRDPGTKRRRPFVRFFVCQADWSHEPPDAPLPQAVANGAEPFVVMGALAGG